MSDQRSSEWDDVPTPTESTTLTAPRDEPITSGGTIRPATAASGGGADTAPMPKVQASPAGDYPASSVAAPIAAPPVAAAKVVPEVAAPPSRRTRKARLRLTRVDPWSVMKTAFLFAIAFGIMVWVSVWVVWGVVEASGLFDSINKVLDEVLGTPGSTSSFKLQDYVSTGRVLGYTALLSVMNIIISTALATLFAFLYNLSATVLGGLEVTLAED